MAQEGLPTRTDVWITEASQEFPPIVGEDSPPEWKPLTVMESFDEAIEIRGDKGALYTKNKEGKWDELTWRQYHQQIMQAGRAFVKLGLPRHAGVAILGFNSVEWFVAKFGGIFAGGIDAGVYQTNGPEAIQHLVTLCDAHICFADSPSALARFYALRDSMPTVKVMVMWGDEEVPASIKSDDNLKIMHWTEFMELGADDVESQRALDEVIATQKPGHVCSLIFTSGTTGPAKGVMLTHDNIMWTAKSSGDFNGSNETSIAISFLPLAHIAAQIIDQLAHLRTGFKVYFAQPDALRGSLADTLREVRPTHFICVPRVWEKMMETIKAQSAKTKGMKKSIGGWARGVGTQAHKNFNEDKGNPWGYFMANQLVFKKVRAALGLDRCVWNVAAAAPISPDVVDYFGSLGILICDCLGLSECTGPACLSHPPFNRHTSVGRCFPGEEFMLANANDKGEGELCFRGRNRFAGYLKNPEETAKAIDAAGWLHTGDLGWMDDGKRAYITGRIKELIVTAGGENIPPILIEDRIKAECDLISKVVVIGDRRKYLSCIISIKCEVDLDTMEPQEALSKNILPLLETLGSEAKTVAEAMECPKIKEALDAALKAANAVATSRAQNVQKFRIIPKDLSLPGGELTPTLKIKRAFVHNKYAEMIDEMYAE